MDWQSAKEAICHEQTLIMPDSVQWYKNKGISQVNSVLLPFYGFNY